MAYSDTCSAFCTSFWTIPARFRCFFLFTLPCFSVFLFCEQMTEKFPNTYEPLTSSPARLTANIHPLNRTCHGSACPLTKDNCDLDKHWGKHKGKGQVLFQFKCAPIHLQHNGDKELQLPPFLKGMWLPALWRRRRKMLILNLIQMKIRGRAFSTNQQQILWAPWRQPSLPYSPLPYSRHLSSPLTNIHRKKGREKLQPEFMIGHIINKLLLF